MPRSAVRRGGGRDSRGRRRAPDRAGPTAPAGILVLFSPPSRLVRSGTVAFSQGIWMRAALPLAAAGLPTLLCAVARQTLDRRQGLSRAVGAGPAPTSTTRRARGNGSPGTRPIWPHTPHARDPGALHRSDRLQPARVSAWARSATRALLKTFHDLVDRDRLVAQSLVVNFMGDGAMVVFGALDPDPRAGGKRRSGRPAISSPDPRLDRAAYPYWQAPTGRSTCGSARIPDRRSSRASAATPISRSRRRPIPSTSRAAAGRGVGGQGPPRRQRADLLTSCRHR